MSVKTRITLRRDEYGDPMYVPEYKCLFFWVTIPMKFGADYCKTIHEAENAIAGYIKYKTHKDVSIEYP
jgi:hypothetical protein